jgi:triacylglycerol esterase/lipase EstA (alpha/beta hydrolase family)
MLARLQQCATLGLLVVALLWAAFSLRAGHAGWALAGALFIVFGYALALALEFAMLHQAHGDDPTPRATVRQLFTAWLGEVASAPLVFCWRQPFFSQRWPDHLPADAAGRRGLLLVHGFVCNRGLWNDWLQRLHNHNVPFVAVNLEPVFGSIDSYVGRLEAAVQRLHQATGQPPVAVAHSMGGLALRRWWAGTDNDKKLHHAVTLATPHQGTWLARFAMTRNARQMRQRSHWLQTLAEDEPPGRAARFTCFYSHCDNIVFPPKVATLPGADNRHLSVVAHVHMTTRSEPFEEVMRLLVIKPR